MRSCQGREAVRSIGSTVENRLVFARHRMAHGDLESAPSVCGPHRAVGGHAAVTVSRALASPPTKRRRRHPNTPSLFVARARARARAGPGRGPGACCALLVLRGVLFCFVCRCSSATRCSTRCRRARTSCATTSAAASRACGATTTCWTRTRTSRSRSAIASSVFSSPRHLPRASWRRWCHGFGRGGLRKSDDDDCGDEDDQVLQNIQIQRTEDGHIAVAKRITRLSAPQSSHRALPWQNATPPSAARETPPRWLAWRQSDTTQRTGHVKNEPVRTRDLAGRPLLLRHPRLQERAQVLHRLDRHDRRGAVRDASARAAHWRDRSPVGRRTGAEERAPGGTKGRAVPREV